MNDLQSHYNDLVLEIYQRGNLDETDRILFYKLHKEVSNRNDNGMRDLLSELRNQKRYNEHYILSDEERAEIFQVLEDKRNTKEGLDRYEYRYLTFLVSKYGFKSAASLPCFPNIIDITLNDFGQRFAFNSQRNRIFEIFKQGLIKCLELYILDTIEVIVGGSYTNIQNHYPNDVDPVILLPAQQWHDDRKHPILNRIINEFPRSDGKGGIFDLHKILAGISDKHYMSYELMTLMGNTPESKIDDGIKDLKFRCRDLLRLRLKLYEISNS